MQNSTSKRPWIIYIYIEITLAQMEASLGPPTWTLWEQSKTGEPQLRDGGASGQVGHCNADHHRLSWVVQLIDKIMHDPKYTLVRAYVHRAMHVS